MTSGDEASPRCAICGDGVDPGFEFSMAFQPIVDVSKQRIFAYEALVRGPAGEPAPSVLERVDERNRYAFDQACRVRAVGLAAGLGMHSRLSINFLPRAVYEPEHCIQATLRACDAHRFDPRQIIFEFTEGERLRDHSHLRDIIDAYRRRGFMTAIDDFGAGHSGLNLLADLQTDLIKIDMALIRGIDGDPRRRDICRNLLCLCEDLDSTAIVEGVETRAEFETLRELGATLFQGYWFARPVFEALAAVTDFGESD